jgi:hypothetical protein
MSSYAQAQGLFSDPLPHAFVGGAIGLASADSQSRMASRIGRQLGEGLGPVWLIEGGARLWGPLGVGLEFFRLPTISASTHGQSFNTAGRQTERVVVGVLRARLAATDKIAADLVAGGGVLFQHHELAFAPCFTGCASSVGSVDRRAPAFAMGFDVPFRLGRHIEVNWLTRFYPLRRADNRDQPTNLWLETKPSALMFIGMSARATW